MSDQFTDVDDLVKQYLLTRGYTKAVELIDKEKENILSNEEDITESSVLAVDDTVKSQEESKKNDAVLLDKLIDNVSKSLFLYGKKKEDIENYIQEYKKFFIWSSSLLENSHSFFHALNFIFFSLIYVTIVKSSDESSSNLLLEEFYNSYKNSFFDSFSNELVYLFNLKHASQLESQNFLESNLYISSLLTNKFLLKIDKFHFFLMMQTLKNFNFFLLLSLILNHIEFIEIQYNTNNLLQNSNEKVNLNPNSLISLPNYSHNLKYFFENLQKQQEESQKELNQEVIGKSNLFSLPTSSTAGSSSIEFFSNNLNSVYYKMLLKFIVLPKIILKKKYFIDTYKKKRKRNEINKNFNSYQDNSMNSPTGGSQDNDVFNDLYTPLFLPNYSLKKSSSIKAYNLYDPLTPSILFSTFGNSEDDLICVNINKNLRQIVTGSRDNIVRVYRIDETSSSDQSTSTSNSSSNVFSTTKSQFFNNAYIKKNNKNYILPSFLNEDYEDYNPTFSTDNENFNNLTDNDSSSYLSGSTYNSIDLIGHSLPVYCVDQSSNYDSGFSLNFNNVYQFFNLYENRSFAEGFNEKNENLFNLFNENLLDDSGNRLVLSGSADKTVRLWDLSLGQSVGLYKTTDAIPWTVKFAPSYLDNFFAAGLSSSYLSLYSLHHAASPIAHIKSHDSDINTLDFHPNFSLIATGSDDKNISFYDIRSNKIVRKIKNFTSSNIIKIKFSTNGNILAISNDVGQIFLYDIRYISNIDELIPTSSSYSPSSSSKYLISLLIGHEGPVYSLEFNTQDDVLVSGGYDCTIKLWDLNKILTQYYENSSNSSTNYDTNLLLSLNMASSSSIGEKNNDTSLSNFEKNNFFMPSSSIILKPYQSFLTKNSLIFDLVITKNNLIFACGPCSLNNVTCK